MQPAAPATIHSARSFSAPPERLFAAFENPEQLAQWYGPEGFTNEFHEFNFQPGAAWRLTMRGPDGTEYPMTKRFLEIVYYELITIRHEQEGHGHTMHVKISKEGSGSRMEWAMVFDDPAEAERVREFVVPANEQNFDRLERLLG